MHTRSASATWWSESRTQTPSSSASAAEHVAEAARLLGIDAGERLVADEDLRRPRERARELEAAPLAPRELARADVHAVGERDALGERAMARPRRGSRACGHAPPWTTRW